MSLPINHGKNLRRQFLNKQLSTTNINYDSWLSEKQKANVKSGYHIIEEIGICFVNKFCKLNYTHYKNFLYIWLELLMNILK